MHDPGAYTRIALQVSDFHDELWKALDVACWLSMGVSLMDFRSANLNRGVDIVVGTPGRLLDLIERKATQHQQSDGSAGRSR